MWYIDRWQAISNLIDAGLKDTQKAVDAIQYMPSADVRPVVTCRECKYATFGEDDGDERGFALEWPQDEWPGNNPCPCKCEDGWYSKKPKPDFFCANGKKREES